MTTTYSMLAGEGLRCPNCLTTSAEHFETNGVDIRTPDCTLLCTRRIPKDETVYPEGLEPSDVDSRGMAMCGMQWSPWGDSLDALITALRREWPKREGKWRDANDDRAYSRSVEDAESMAARVLDRFPEAEPFEAWRVHDICLDYVNGDVEGY